MNKKDMKVQACRRVEELNMLIDDIASHLHRHPELSGKEHKSARYLRRLLQEYGFHVKDLVPEMYPTAFQATAGTGKVHIGFLAEYDALPGIGHGCGHNLIAAMSIGAAAALAAVASDAAAVHVYGCPAEETTGSKVYMSDHGVFDGLDAALILHPCSDMTSIGGTSYASHPMEFTFIGKAAHIADKAYAGINALDVLIDFYGRMKKMEQTWTQEHLIGAIITDGGTAPNIVPDKAVLRATIRALDTAYLENVMLPQLRQLAEMTAAYYGAAVQMTHYEPLYKNMINDKLLSRYFADAFSLLGERFFIRDDTDADGSSDVGNVSHVTRACQPEICIASHVAAHTAEFAAAAGSTEGKMKALVGAKALVMTAIDIIAEKHYETFI